MHRLLVETDELNSDSPALSKDAANHLRVLRLKDGEEVELFDGRGRWRVCAYSGGRLAPSAPAESTPRRASLTLFACVTKGSRWDWTIEKSTELGATRIVPVISDRTIVRIPPSEREAKCARWMRVAEDAARQSDAKWLPEILSPVDFAASLPLVRETICFVGALAIPRPQPILQAVQDRIAALEDVPPLSVYVGPEGDFTPAELAVLCEVATPVTFGTTILRAETAAIYALSALKTVIDVRAR